MKTEKERILEEVGDLHERSMALWCKGRELRVKGIKLHESGEKIRIEALKKLYPESDKLFVNGREEDGARTYLKGKLLLEEAAKFFAEGDRRLEEAEGFFMEGNHLHKKGNRLIEESLFFDVALGVWGREA
jgi:hypothetical protein